MCDTIEGELLVSLRSDDPAGQDLMNRIRDKQIEHVSFVDSLSGRLEHAGLPWRKIGYDFCRLRVPAGDENYKIGVLQFFYKHALLKALDDPYLHMPADVMAWSNKHLQVVPHSWLSIRQPPAAQNPIGIGFNTTPIHNDYKNICGLPAQPAAGGKARRILILDTGLDPASQSTVVSEYNFVDDAKPNDVTDDNGHGTAVTEIIRDLCPSAEFVIYKVADSTGRASEFDTMAALGVDNDVDIANISLAFGLDDTNCPHCGRESRSSRSAVFENFISQLSGEDDPNSAAPLIIAAAGNGSKTELSFPARFDNVLAIESINKAGQLSHFTNRANLNHEGKNHANVFVLPGGDKPAGGAPTEYVGTSKAGKQYYGTSFAAAYASGLIAALWVSGPWFVVRWSGSPWSGGPWLAVSCPPKPAERVKA